MNKKEKKEAIEKMYANWTINEDEYKGLLFTNC